MLTKNIIVSGRVQGVGFRYFVHSLANTIGELNGYVRNMPDGTVKIIVQGSKKKIDFLVKQLYIGTGMSRVDNVEIYESDTDKKFEGFNIAF